MLSVALKPFIEGSNAFIQKMHFAFQGSAMHIMKLGVELWVVWYLIDNVFLQKGNIDPPKLFKKLLIIFLALKLIDDYNAFVDYLYEPVKSFFDGAVMEVSDFIPFVDLGAGSVTPGTQYQTLDMVWNIFLKSRTIVSKIEAPHWYQVPMIQAGSLIVMLPYFGMAVGYGFFYAEFIIKMAIIGGLSPFLIAAYAFDKTKPWATGALKILFHGGVTILIATMVVAFSATTLESLFLDGLDPKTGVWSAEEGLGMPILMMIAVGFILALFMLKAPTIASNITGASDGPGAAAGLAALAGGAMMKMGSGVAGQAWGGWGDSKKMGMKAGLSSAAGLGMSAAKMGTKGVWNAAGAMSGSATRSMMTDKSIDTFEP